jgi:heterodisulfide reductase subunit A
VGNFKARIRRKARYVDENNVLPARLCGCVPRGRSRRVPDGTRQRKAVHIPFPQAVPSAYIVANDECLGQNPIACGKCIEACEKKCISFDMEDQLLDLEVGAVIVATGMDVYNPAALDEYGYTHFPNVVTSMEFERLVSTGGPLGGHWGRPSDLERPRRIGFVQCVGSRTQDLAAATPVAPTSAMNTVKEAQYLKDNYPDTDITVFTWICAPLARALRIADAHKATGTLHSRLPA